MAEVTAKVAGLISDIQLAINAGANAGITEGYIAQLFRTVTVTDPDTSEELGAVRLIKLNLRVSHVQQKLCVATVTDYESAPHNPISIVTAQSRNRKRITDSPAAVVKGQFVLVKIGEPVLLTPPVSSEPPF